MHRTSWKLKAVSKNKDDTFALTYDTPDGQKQLKTRTVVLTVPAYIAADLLQEASAAAADKLRGFDYPPVGAITLAYPLSSIRDDRKDKERQIPGVWINNISAGSAASFNMVTIGCRKPLFASCNISLHPLLGAVALMYPLSCIRD